MIRLRRLLERGRRHPLLGPIVLILLVLLLAMVCFHATQDGWDGAAEFGAACIAITTVLGAVVCQRLRWQAPLLYLTGWFERGPPHTRDGLLRPVRAGSLELALPLRR